MRPYLLIDFGSTYTKMIAVDLDEARLLGTARAFTTVQDGLILGYQNALQELTKQLGKLEFEQQLACSSAAGGLKMVALGLVPELTGEAARLAALGAGARVVGSYGYQLTLEEIAEIIGLQPDLLLLTGGTDGGNQESLLKNAQLLSESKLVVPIIIAGNKNVASEAEEILKREGKEVYRTSNVLPKLDQLQIEPVQQLIRELFLQRIIQAKGLKEIEARLSGLTMPTPAAALAAAECLADGISEIKGLGELMVLDVGGATTDVHSIAEGAPTQTQVYWHGLREPRVKRTVEGDLGMRYTAPSVLEIFGIQALMSRTSLLEAEIRYGVERRAAEVTILPTTSKEMVLEEALGYFAVKGAVERHVGKLTTSYTPAGMIQIQTGKDFSNLGVVIGTGGILAGNSSAGRILKGALLEPERFGVLKPIAPRLFVDRDYLLPTLGLIAKDQPRVILELLKGSLVEVCN